MRCCNELASVLETTVFDPTRHVNFAKGMVLGVDDFRQEFAYLAGRDQWLSRDGIGYGTLSGLRVFTESSGAEGSRLHVTAGSALVPSGKLVCVEADQCAVLNKWLAKPANAAIVTQLLNPASPPASPPLSPPDVTSGAIALYLTLCYDDCTAYPVPVPGEPCRTEDELMADSRVVDDFRIELRKDPPAQVEEDALRDFVKWLRESIQVVTIGSPSAIDENAWLEALRPAAQPWLDAAAMSSPASFETLGDYLFTLSPPTIEVAQEQVCAFLRVAFRFWVTELRPLWMARRCHVPMVKDQDCVLLARIEFDVEFVGGSPTGAWVVTGSPTTVVIDETRRPFLVHLRMLQEWMMCGCECTGLGALAGMGGGGGGSTFFGGPVPVAFAKLNASTTLGTLHHIVLAEGAAGPMRLTLPSAGPGNTGRAYVIRNVDVANLSANTAPGTSDRIETSASLAIARDEAVTLVADGAGTWRVVNRTQ
jgi:hypothetical protein